MTAFIVTAAGMPPAAVSTWFAWGAEQVEQEPDASELIAALGERSYRALRRPSSALLRLHIADLWLDSDIDVDTAGRATFEARSMQSGFFEASASSGAAFFEPVP